MGDGTVLGLAVVFLLIAAFGGMAETAIDRMNAVRAMHLVQSGRRGATKLLKIVEDPAPYLNFVLLVTLFSHVLATALVVVFALRNLEPVGQVLAVATTGLVLFVFGQLVPKTYTVQRTERAALAVAVPVYFLARLLAPLTKTLISLANATMLLLPGKGLPKGPFITEDEIRHLVDVAEKEEEIEEEERELIHSIFEFGDTVVREVMVPRPDMVTIPANAKLDEALETVVKAGFSRIPMYEGDNDNITGVLYAKDLLKRVQSAKGNVKISSLARTPSFVPEQKKVAELLREMQKERVHMSIVVDEYGGTAGLVTIEDLLEEIVGEIVDEYDKEEPLVEPIDDSTLRVDAKMPIDEVNELLEVELPHEEWDTVGGLVFGLIGRVPQRGEAVTYDSLEFVAEKVSGRRIQKVVITKLPHPLKEAARD